MFERFTARARHTVVLSQEEARQLKHNYIGTEHILLGLLGEPEAVAGKVLASFGITLDGTRDEVTGIVGTGDEKPVKGHIPFTPRAKKTLELALREALALHHNCIGTEHILLGLIREGDGIAAQVLRSHADLLAIRSAVFDAVPSGAEPSGGAKRRWLRRLISGEPGEPGPSGTSEASEQAVLSATPAADITLSEASRIAGAQAVGSHHLLLAALSDSDSAAARVLTQLGLDLDQAKEALLGVDVAGTSDEQPEDAGRRQLTIAVTGDSLTLSATDPVLVKAGNEAVAALGDRAEAGTIRGRDLSAGGGAADALAKAWQALNDALTVIKRAADATAAEAGKTVNEKTAEGEEKGKPDAEG